MAPGRRSFKGNGRSRVRPVTRQRITVGISNAVIASPRLRRNGLRSEAIGPLPRAVDDREDHDLIADHGVRDNVRRAWHDEFASALDAAGPAETGQNAKPLDEFRMRRQRRSAARGLCSATYWRACSRSSSAVGRQTISIGYFDFRGLGLRRSFSVPQDSTQRTTSSCGTPGAPERASASAALMRATCQALISI